jgi:hypothetical protein
MRVAVSAAALAAACSKPPAPVERRTPLANAQSQAPHAKPNALAERADAALDSDTPSDYERPFAEKPVERDATRELFVDACKAGDHASCWKAMYVGRDLVGFHAAELPTLDLLATNCRAGDTWSCRALPIDRPLYRWKFDDAAGGMGRSEACDQPTASCDLAVLRRECDAGFAWSCSVLASSGGAGADAARLRKRAEDLALEDCTHDIVHQCQGDMTANWPEAARSDALRRMCRYSRLACVDVAASLEKRGETKDVRELRELACQYTQGGVGCARLAAGYLDGKYTEPVPGRGQQLLDWTCARTQKQLNYDRKQLEKAWPECKRASK